MKAFLSKLSCAASWPHFFAPKSLNSHNFYHHPVCPVALLIVSYSISLSSIHTLLVECLPLFQLLGLFKGCPLASPSGFALFPPSILSTRFAISCFILCSLYSFPLSFLPPTSHSLSFHSLDYLSLHPPGVCCTNLSALSSTLPFIPSSKKCLQLLCCQHSSFCNHSAMTWSSNAGL